ncbi:hypothetical protein Ahy_A02g005040 isoform C [Arachis hypogaea]|uniref:Uncharacterized protein n=1 Tax=Arachis hypogaea TaxID=3818 RepID=A0A445E5K7_ARAHY|nr:hypothetical protein Ahy_A02g005040 isoform C [Arachis hypogaea]
MVTRIEEIIDRLEDIAKHKDILRLEKIAAKNMSGRIPSTSLVKKSDIFVGRDKERDTIVKLLLDDSNNGELSVIPIVGMGGIGKTTLAKLVYNNEKVQQKFHVKAWVCVGEEFDVLMVTKAVIEKTCSPCNSNDLDTVQNHLKNALVGKNFLVVQDDVWSSNCEGWESFLIPFECGSEGGKILVTSRLDTVASMVKTKHNEAHNLSLLDEEECWLDSIPKIWEACSSLKHARTLLKTSLIAYETFPDERVDSSHLLEQLKCLRVLSFKFFCYEEDLLHDSIGELIHLRYLDLSGQPVMMLPESLSNLYNLQTLKLRDCSNLKKLPTNMQDLVNLCHLDIHGTDLEDMPKGMNKLKDLQFLSDYVVGKHEENGIGELGELANLHGTFYVQKLENVISSVAASNARMDEKIHLNDLSLKWSSGEDSDIDDSQVEKDVLDKLRPHKGRKKLKIEGFRGTMLPDWVAHSFYNNMTFLELRGCKTCWMVPSLGQLPSLMELRLDGFDMVKIIGAEFYKSDRTHHHHHHQTPFRSLKALFISHMRWWEEWESFECDDAPFPQLKQLSIWECPKLRGDLPAFLPSLKSLYIEDCEQLGCYLPRASIIRELRIYGKQEARMQDLPLSLQQLSIEGNQLVESVFGAMTRTQPTSITGLWISNCSSAISFPGNSLPPSLKELGIMNCKNMEFPMQQQHHHDCVSLTSMVLEAFPNLTSITIKRCENLRSLEVVPQSQSLEGLSIEGCPKMENIAGERLPASLRFLFISECPLLGESIKRKDLCIWPTISHLNHICIMSFGEKKSETIFTMTSLNTFIGFYYGTAMQHMKKIFQVLDVVILCWLSTWTRSYAYIVESWTTFRVTFAPCLVSHPNLRPFITFLGVALACLLMALIGFERRGSEKDTEGRREEDDGTGEAKGSRRRRRVIEAERDEQGERWIERRQQHYRRCWCWDSSLELRSSPSKRLRRRETLPSPKLTAGAARSYLRLYPASPRLTPASPCSSELVVLLRESLPKERIRRHHYSAVSFTVDAGEGHRSY